MKKNVAGQVVGAQLNSLTDGSPVTSGTTTAYVLGDGGTQAAGTVGSGACTHEGNGFWTYAPAQAETNHDHVAFTFVNTAAINATVQIYPSFPQTGDPYARLGAPAGASTAADIAAVLTKTPDAAHYTNSRGDALAHLDADVSAVKAKTDNLPNSAIVHTTGKLWVLDSSGNAIAPASDSAAIKAKTDNLPSDPADASDIAGLLSTITSSASAIFARLGAPAGASVSADIAAAKTVIDAIKLITDHLATAIELDGSVYRFTSNALEQAPGGGSGGATAGEIAGAVWDEVLSGHVTAGTAGLVLAALSTIANAIKAKTDNLPSDPADQSLVIAATDALMTRIGAPAGASVSADVAGVKSDTAAIKAKTNQLAFSQANVVDANIKRVNDVAVTGTGVTDDEWGPA